MPKHSRLARLQQCTTLSLWLAAAVWLVTHWSPSPLQAVLGAIVIVFAASWVLAVEFLLLGLISRSDSVPAPTPIELVRAWAGETVQVFRVFCWRQPFRWAAVPDHLDADCAGRRGVVFIHGFVCNRGIWAPWMLRLQADGTPCIAVNLEPVFGHIDEYPPVIEAAVARMEQATGLPPLVVCHSMGGLAIRAWLRLAGNSSRVHHVATIGTPHHGTWLGRFSHTPNGREMRLDSRWLAQLRADEASSPAAPFTCWYSHCDNIVFPTSTAMLPGADNRLVRGPAHVALAFAPEVMEGTLALLRTDEGPAKP